MIPPKEAFRIYGPPPLIIRDACGRQLRHVSACNPLTGEVTDLLPADTWIGPLLIATESVMERIGAALLRRGVVPPPAEIARRHWFAPAPLTITRSEAP